MLVKSEHQQVEGISFLLACYNESETVQDTLSSVLSLEYPEKEIIIINDGSSDNTAEIIYEFKKIMILNLLTSKSIEVKLMHSMRESNKHLTNMLCA
ncbi:N-glycosyltransferase [Staphylococcus epidermidis 41tr]|nr:N-glycosyltransferase [Staphylococcus epidermidis 41tr]